MNRSDAGKNVRLARARCIRNFASAVRAQDDPSIIDLMRELDQLGCWHEAIEQFLTESKGSLAADLLMFWNVHGFHAAASLRGDPIFLDALRHHVAPYRGPPRTLYRGELKARHLRRVYGIAWTSQLHTAEAFAVRREVDEGRGVVLKIDATSEMIVSAPTERSYCLQEGEYVVDTRLIRGVTVIPTQLTPE
jgi:hypothetical protein